MTFLYLQMKGGKSQGWKGQLILRAGPVLWVASKMTSSTFFYGWQLR